MAPSCSFPSCTSSSNLHKIEFLPAVVKKVVIGKVAGNNICNNCLTRVGKSGFGERGRACARNNYNCPWQTTQRLIKTCTLVKPSSSESTLRRYNIPEYAPRQSICQKCNTEVNKFECASKVGASPACAKLSVKCF